MLSLRFLYAFSLPLSLRLSLVSALISVLFSYLASRVERDTIHLIPVPAQFLDHLSAVDIPEAALVGVVGGGAWGGEMGAEEEKDTNIVIINMLVYLVKLFE